jgi:hypothetical protein
MEGKIYHKGSSLQARDGNFDRMMRSEVDKSDPHRRMWSPMEDHYAHSHGRAASSDGRRHFGAN